MTNDELFSLRCDEELIMTNVELGMTSYSRYAAMEN